MATEKQIIANRRNAQLSTGPRTEEGRAVSRLNAYQHGLTGQIEVMTPDEKAIHDKFCDDIVAVLLPTDALESQFAQSVAEGHWRLNRARTIENNIFTLARSFEEGPDNEEVENPEVDKALASARTFVADPARFQLLTTYEMRINRKMLSDLKQLKELQAERRALAQKEKTEDTARRAQAFEEACLITQLDESEGTTVDPASEFRHPIGFVFSTAQIIDANRFASRLQAARALARRAESSPSNQPIRRAA